jgi:hypothetical protein
MKFSLFKEYGALNSKPIFNAFEQSLIDRGFIVCNNDMHCDVAVIWSVLWNGRMAGNKPIWDYYRKTQRPVIVLEVGSINRGITWKVGLNGINRNAILGPKDNNNIRAQQLGLTVQPWQKDGDVILVCGQHDKSLQWKNMPTMSSWFLETYNTLREHTERPIVFRPHPRCKIECIEKGLIDVYRQDPVYINSSYDSYNLNFTNIWATISWSSSPGIQSIINGVTSFVGPDSLAFDVANHNLKDIEHPLYPDRTQWLNDYAWTEYTVEEIASGMPLDFLTTQL